MAPLPDPTADLDKRGREIFDKLAGRRGGLSGMYLALMNHPDLADRIGVLGTFLRFEGTLPGDVRETAILIAARLMRSGYEWEKHTSPAAAAHVAEKTVEAIRRGDFAALGERDRLVHEVAETVLGERSLPAALQSRLEAAFGLRGVVELVVLIGFYRMINAVIVSFDVALPEAGPAPF